MNELSGQVEVNSNKQFTARGTELVTPARSWQNLLEGVSKEISDNVGSHDMKHFSADVVSLDGEKHYEWEAKGEIL